MKLSYGRRARHSRRRRPTPSLEGGNERLARVTFRGNSIVESCKVIERRGAAVRAEMVFSGLFPPPSNLPSSLFLPPCHSAPFPALLINKADSAPSVCSNEGGRRVGFPAALRSSGEAAPDDDGPGNGGTEELTNFQQVFSRFAAI